MRDRFPSIRFRRLACVLLGALVGAQGVCLAFSIARFDIAQALTFGIALLWMALGAFYRQVVKSAWGKALRTVFFCGLAAAAALSGFLGLAGAGSTAEYDEDVLIVLGDALCEGEATLRMKNRLDAACAYLQRNEKALVVVSGGRNEATGPSEADVMRRYLAEKGVAQERILTEDRAANTRENFLYAKALLRARKMETRTVAFVTNDFHVYRAASTAAATGLRARAVSAGTPWALWIPSYLRECLGVMEFWVRGVDD